MKKILLLLVSAFLLIGCTAEEVPNQVTKDCNCNRVISISNQSIPGTNALGSYVTKNDCNGSLQRSNFSETFPCPKIGDCE